MDKKRGLGGLGGGWLFLMIFLMVFLAGVPSLEAIGIEGRMLSPLIYEPGGEIKEKYCVYNYNYGIEVGKGGDFSEAVSLGPLAEEGGRKCFELKIKFPEEIPATGTYYITFYAAEVGEEGIEGTVGALTSVTRMIKVEVYSQEKDIKIFLNTPNANENETMKFTLAIQSWSYQDIDKVSGRIIVYDEKNQSLASLKTKEVGLKSKESKTLSVKFDNTGLKPGNYRAEAVVDFDGKQAVAESYFKIGTLELSLLNWSKEVETGGIQPFFMTVRSNWNRPVEEVFGVLFVEGEKVLQTPTISLGPWGEDTLKGYWEVGREPGEYEGKIELHFGEKIGEKKIKVLVKEKTRLEQPSQFNKINLGLTAIIILLVILLTIAYRKKR